MAFSRIALLLLALLGAVALPASAARVDSVAVSLERGEEGSPQLRLRFDTVAGVEYRLRESSDLAAWSDAGQSVVGDGSPRALEAELSGGARFFEVVARLGDTFVSAITGVEYPFRVYTPVGYESGGAAYPIIYSTDGQWNSAGFSQALAAKGAQAILVCIDQGPGDRRAIDYTLPGARRYFEFLTTELMPAVESVYRVDPDRRGISGLSYGGLFVSTALLLDDPEEPLFRHYLCYDGSFWRDPDLISALESERAAKGGTLNATLFLTSTTGAQGNNNEVTWFQNLLQSRGYQGLVIRRLPPYTIHHNDVGQPSFEAALDLFY